MKMFDKIRDLFTEVVEEENPVKKEVIQVEIPAPAPKKEEIKVTEERVAPVTPKEPVKTQEDKFNFPVFFDEKDFDDISKKEEKKPEMKKDLKREPYGVKKEMKEEKKHFAPTPIISPVYGVLDKNYKKDDIVDKPRKTSFRVDNMTIDDVRNKAYGTLEDELESTLFGKTSIMFATKEEEATSISDIEEDLRDTADALDLLSEDHEISKNEEPKHKKKETVNTKNRLESIDDILNSKYDIFENDKTDLDELVDDNTNMVEDALNSDFSSDDKLSESDLFNLIDNMYEKGDK